VLKILVVDDHAIVRAGLKQLLADTDDMLVEGEAGSGSEAIKMVREESWDVVLLDMTMPGKSGLDVLKMIKKEQSNLPVLVLSMHPEDQYAIRVLKAGASGYLNKRCVLDQLVNVIRKVAKGGRYISESVAEKLAFSSHFDSEKLPHELLSDREFQVFHLLASGITVSGIAMKLSLSAKTISTHRSNILKKMDMRNNADLMRYAVENDLVS